MTTKNQLSKVYNMSYYKVAADSRLIDKGYNFDKKSTPIMQALAAQMELTRKSLGVR